MNAQEGFLPRVGGRGSFLRASQLSSNPEICSKARVGREPDGPVVAESLAALAETYPL
jgi:hypothetical protein